MNKRSLYLSANGDSWFLCRDDNGSVFVLHEPNKSSGGGSSKLPVGEFLMRGNPGPQHQALLDLIGGLVEEEAAD